MRWTHLCLESHDNFLNFPSVPVLFTRGSYKAIHRSASWKNGTMFWIEPMFVTSKDWHKFHFWRLPNCWVEHLSFQIGNQDESPKEARQRGRAWRLAIDSYIKSPMYWYMCHIFYIHACNCINFQTYVTANVSPANRHIPTPVVARSLQKNDLHYCSCVVEPMAHHTMP